MLLEGQEFSSSEFDPTPTLSIADTLKKELESMPLTPSRFVNFQWKSDQMAQIHREL